VSQSQDAGAAGTVKPVQVAEKIRPTLYIALGGTGMKVHIRLRRRILNTIWGGNMRVENISDFPVAQFINLALSALSVGDYLSILFSRHSITR